MNEKLKEMREAWKNLYGSLFKWIVLSGVIGSFIGLIASGFSYAIVWVTSFRQANPMIILGLPLGGLLIVWMYKITGQEKNSGTNLVLTVVRSDEEEVPGMGDTTDPDIDSDHTSVWRIFRTRGCSASVWSKCRKCMCEISAFE